MNHIVITDQEHATILAALRYYQKNGQGEPNNRSDDFHTIATPDDCVISMDADGIDELCEKLNCETVDITKEPNLTILMLNDCPIGVYASEKQANDMAEVHRKNQTKPSPYTPHYYTRDRKLNAAPRL